ncbi:MAG: TIGR01244 family sulfur transferase [Pseudomonadota bacterium]
MDLRQVAPRYFVSPQIGPEDIPDLVSAGITRILCNRPDDEVPPSHCAEVIRAAAETTGITFAQQPLTMQRIVPEVVAANRALGADTEDVTLAYCTSGTRSCLAWALGQAGRMTVQDILDATRAAGYQFEHLKPMLDHRFTEGS